MLDIKEAIELISNKEIREMTKLFLGKYSTKMNQVPASLSNKHHLGETNYEHVKRALYFTLELCKEFGVPKIDEDILISATILHDIACIEFASKERNPEEYQKLFVTGYNRSKEAYVYHPTLSHFLIGRYIVNNRLISEPLIRVANLVLTHMSHWLNEYNPEPETLLEFILCTADYFSSRKEIVISE